MLTFVATCVALGVLPHQDTKTLQESPSAIDPQAIEALESMVKYLDSLDRYQVHADATWAVRQPSGLHLHFSAHLSAYVDRPDVIQVTRRRDDGIMSGLQAKGGKAKIWVGDTHNIIDTPSSIDAALDTILDRYAISAPLVDFVYSDSGQTFLHDVRSAIYVGKVKINPWSTPSHHIAIRKDDFDYQLWIKAQGPAVPEKYVVSWKDQPDQPWFEAHFISSGEWTSEPLNIQIDDSGGSPGDLPMRDPQPEDDDRPGHNE
jgi:hypothetical protein